MAEITLMRTPAEQRLGEQFKASGAGQGAREAAFAAFSAKGLPHRRIEAWHYTDLRSLLREAFPPTAAPNEVAVAAAAAHLANQPAAGLRVVLVDGHLAPTLSSLGAAGAVTIAPLLDGAGSEAAMGPALQAAEALGATESVLNLNTAFLQGGVVVTVSAAADQPIEIVSVVLAAAPGAVTTRVLVEVKDGAAATIVERHIGLGTADMQGNHALVFAVGQGATLDHVCAVEGAATGALHIGSMLVRLDAECRFNSFVLTASAGLVRRQAMLEFAGENSNARLNGVSLLEGKAHADTTLLVTHTAGHCESREYFKSILDDESTGVYQGKVVVAPGAQKTDGKMMSRAIFLADGASMYNKPELEIFADDVVCGHGATVGYLDDTQLFYLRARGIPLAEAQSLLLNAFAADAIDDVQDEGLREQLTGSVARWLARRHL